RARGDASDGPGRAPAPRAVAPLRSGPAAGGRPRLRGLPRPGEGLFEPDRRGGCASPGGPTMSRRMTALATTLGVAVATLTSALALDEPAARPQAPAAAKVEIRPRPAGPTGAKTTVTRVEAVKAAPVFQKEAMKKAVAAKIVVGAGPV